MAERYRFSAAYEPAMLRSATRAYLWRLLVLDHNWISTGLMFVVVIAIVFGIYVRDLGFMSGLFAGFALALALLIVLYGWQYWRGAAAQIARMRDPRAEFIVSDDGFEVRTDRGSGRVPWDAIHQIWEFKQGWLMMLDDYRFMTLPLAGAPDEALRFIEARVSRPVR